MIGPRESAVQAAVLAYLEERGDCFVWRNNTGAYSPRPGQFISFGRRGSGDIIGVIAPSGKLVAIECKRPVGGRLSKDQERFRDRVWACGGIYILARSVDEVRVALPAPTVRLPPERQRVIPR